MKTFALDENWDWTFNLKSGIFALEQSLKTRIKQIREDCQFDLEAGVDLTLFDKNKEQFLKNQLLDIILKTDGVVNATVILDILNNRTLQIKYSVQTIYSNKLIQNTLIYGNF